MLLGETPRRKLVTQLVTWGHWFALLNILIAITIAAIYILNSPAPGTAVGTLYLFANWISHIGFLTFIAFVIFILPLCYLIPDAKIVKSLSSVIAAIGLALLAFDALLYNKYGVHLSFNSAELIRSEAQTAIAQFGWQQWGFLLLLFVVWLSFQLIVANALWQRIERLQKRKLGRPISGFFVSCFVLSHALHVWADAKLYQPIVQQDNMFPLSYPATAKTLMARYSLLDMQDYQQRKALQFNQTIQGINYPSQPVYCSVDADKKVLVLLVDDGPVPTKIDGLNQSTRHFVLGSTPQSALTSAIYGLPELYHPALTGLTPLLLQLPDSLGLKLTMYTSHASAPEAFAPYQNTWQDFKQQVTSSSSNLAIGMVNKSQLGELLTEAVVQQYQLMLSSLVNQGMRPQSLMTNFTANKNLSSLEDIAPSALDLLGCNAQASTYSTGASIAKQNPVNYVVSTQGNKVMLFTQSQRIEIMTNGNVRVFDIQSGQESFEQVNTDVLSQGIKHLTRFSNKAALRPI